MANGKTILEGGGQRENNSGGGWPRHNQSYKFNIFFETLNILSKGFLKSTCRVLSGELFHRAQFLKSYNLNESIFSGGGGQGIIN